MIVGVSVSTVEEALLAEEAGAQLYRSGCIIFNKNKK